MSTEVALLDTPPKPLLNPQQMESMYAGLDKMQAALPVDVADRVSEALAGSPDPEGDKASFANIAFLADAYGKQPDEVAGALDAYREAYAKDAFKITEPIDDKAFYVRVGQHYQQLRDERALMGEAQGKMFDAFRQGGDNWRQSFTASLAEMKGKPGYDPARLDLYRHLAQQQWQAWEATGQHYPAVVDAVSSYMKLWQTRTGTEEQQLQARQGALRALQSVPESEQDAVLGLAVRGSQTAKEGQSGAGGAEKLAGRVEQGIGAFARDAATSLRDLVTAQPTGLGFAGVLADQAGRKAERRLDAAILGQDPYKGANWLSEATLGAAEGLPRMLAMFHPAGIVANVTAYSEEARGHFEDAGVDPAKAAGLGLVASIPLTALMAVSSKTLVGGAAQGSMEAWMLRNITGKAGSELVKGYAKNILAQGAENTAVLATVTAGMQMTEPAIQSVGNLLDGTIPGVQWTGKDGELMKLAKATPETLASLVPLIVLGTGIGTLRNAAMLRATVQNKPALEAVGLKPEAVKAVMEAPTPEAAVQTLQENFAKREPNSAAVEAVNNAQPTKPEGVSLAPDGSYVVKDAAGAVIDQAATPEMAAKAAQDASKVIDFPGLSDADRARMRAEEAGQASDFSNEVSLKDWIKGKLPHPETAGKGGESLSGELKMLREFFVKEDKAGRLNYGEAAKWFAKKGEYVSLDDLTAEARAAGFNFSTPADLLTAVDAALRGKDTLSQRGSTEESTMAFGIAAGGGKIGEVLNNEIASAKQAIREMTSLPVFKGFKEVLNRWVGDTQLGIMHTAADIRQVVDALPDVLTRKAIGRWLDAGGDRGQLEAWLNSSTKLEARKEYAAALKLTPEQIKVAENLREWFKSRFDRAVAAGVMDEAQFRQNYLTQLIERPFVQGGADSKFGAQLNKNFKFSKERVFPNLYELEKAGFSAKTTDIAEIMARYDSALNKAILSRQLVKDLLATKNEQGQPLAVPLRGTIKEGEGSAPNFINNPRQTLVDQIQGQIDALQKKAAKLVDDISSAPDFQTKFDLADELKGVREEIRMLRDEHSAEDALLYKSIDHPALRKWWWAGKDQASGKDVFMEGDIGLHPDIKTHLENALGTSGLRKWFDSQGNALSAIPKRVVKALDVSNGFLKRNLLGGFSLFHSVHEYKRALGNRVAVKPWALPEIDPTNERVKLQLRTGLMLATPHDVTNIFSHQTGLGEAGSLVDRIPVIGKFSQAVSEYTFQKLIPSVKSEVWNHVYERNLETFKDAIARGEATKDQVAYLTSHQINARFGHQNYADLGRNPTVQHWAQLLLLAPDFWESNIRNYGQAIQGVTGAKVGREPIVAFAVTGAALWITARVINQALDDDWHFAEPFGVIHDGRRYTMRNEVEDLWRMWQNSRQYVMGRLSPTLNAVEEWRGGRNWRGEKITTFEVFKNWVSKVFPMSLRWVPGIKQATDYLESGGGRNVGTFQQLLGSIGVQVSRHSPLNDAYQMANDWKQAQGEEPDKGTYPVSKYQQLRYALEDGDTAKAQVEMQKLQDAGEPPGKIVRGFRQSILGPWTGSRMKDAQFRESLDAGQKAKLAKADAHREAVFQRFLKLVNVPDPGPTD